MLEMKKGADTPTTQKADKGIRISIPLKNDLPFDKSDHHSPTKRNKDDKGEDDEIENPIRFVGEPYEYIKNVVVSQTPNTMEKTSYFGNLFYVWVNTLFDMSRNKLLMNKEILTCGKLLRSQEILDDFQKVVSNAKNPEDRQPVNVAKKIISYNYRLGIFLYVFANCLEFSIPWLVSTHTSLGKKYSKSPHGWLISIGIILAILTILIIRYLVFNRALFYIRASGARISAILRLKIFEKLLKITESAKTKYTESKMLNLMTFDLDNISIGLFILPDFINAFVILTIGYIYLINYYTVVFVIIILTILAVLAFIFIHRQTSRYKKSLLEVNDEKSKLIKKVLKDIFFIKTFGLEKMFYEGILKLYIIQNHLSRWYMIWDQTASVIAFYLPTLFTFCIFGYKVLTDKEGSNEENSSYLVLTVLSIMRNPIASLAEAFKKWPNNKASLSRVNEFFKLEERHFVVEIDVEPGLIELKDCDIEFWPAPDNSKQEDLKNTIRSATNSSEVFSVDHHLLTSRNELEFENLNFRIEQGTKCALISDENLNSTLLLNALASELKVSKGSLKSCGDIMIQDKTLHFIHDTVQQNILIGQEYEHEKYLNILKLVGLEEMFTKLPNLQKVIISNNGFDMPIDLKKLIILARLLYSDPDIYLIDHFFDDLPLKYRRFTLPNILAAYSSKTFVVSTSFKDVFVLMNRCIFLSGRKVLFDSPFPITEDSYQDFFEDILIEHESSHFKQDFDLLPTHKFKVSTGSRGNSQFREIVATRRTSQQYLKRVAEIPAKKIPNENEYDPDHPEYQKKLRIMQRDYHLRSLYFEVIPDETQKSRWFVIFKFFLLNSGWKLPTVILLLIVMNITIAYTFSWYVSQWRQQRLIGLNLAYKLRYFIIITSSTLGILAATGACFVWYNRRSSFKLFIFLIKGIFGHGVEFFHKLSSAQVINSIITEFLILDETMGANLQNLFIQIIRLHVVFAITLYKTYIMGFFILVVYCLILRILLRAGSGVKALATVVQANQSVITQTILHSYRNIPFYRNNKKIKYHFERFKMLNQVFQNSKVHQNNFADRWFQTRVQGFVLFLPVLILLNGFFRNIFGLSADQWQSLKLTISLDLVFSISGLISSSVSRAIMIASLEKIRLLVAIDQMTYRRINISREKKLNSLPLHQEPSSAQPLFKIESLTVANPVTNLCMIENISLSIKLNQKVAIVGSRGSGKSTLLAAIQRLINPSQVLSGRIFLDGNDLNDMTDKQMNDRIVRLTGEYKIYNGCLKMNIDPSNRCTLEEVERILDYVGYWAFTKADYQRSPSRSNNHRRLSNKSKADNLPSLKHEYEIPSAYFSKIPLFSHIDSVVSKPVEDDLQNRLKIQASKLEDSINKTIKNDHKNLLKFGKVKSEIFTHFIQLIPKSQNKMSKIANKNIQNTYGEMDDGMIGEGNIEKYLNIEPISPREKNENSQKVLKNEFIDNGDVPMSARDEEELEFEILDDGDLRVEGCSFEDAEKDKLCTELMNEYKKILNQDKIKPGQTQHRERKKSQFEFLPTRNASLSEWEQKNLVPSPKYQKYLTEQKSWESEDINQFEKVLLQIARLLIMKPKMTLVTKDFTTGIEIADKYILDLLNLNIEKSCLISIVDDYELLENFNEVIVMDRGNIIERDTYYNLMSDDTSHLSKLVRLTKH